MGRKKKAEILAARAAKRAVEKAMDEDLVRVASERSEGVDSPVMTVDVADIDTGEITVVVIKNAAAAVCSTLGEAVGRSTTEPMWPCCSDRTQVVWGDSELLEDGVTFEEIGAADGARFTLSTAPSGMVYSLCGEPGTEISKELARLEPGTIFHLRGRVFSEWEPYTDLDECEPYTDLEDWGHSTVVVMGSQVHGQRRSPVLGQLCQSYNVDARTGAVLGMRLLSHDCLASTATCDYLIEGEALAPIVTLQWLPVRSFIAKECHEYDYRYRGRKIKGDNGMPHRIVTNFPAGPGAAEAHSYTDDDLSQTETVDTTEDDASGSSRFSSFYLGKGIQDSMRRDIEAGGAPLHHQLGHGVRMLALCTYVAGRGWLPVTRLAVYNSRDGAPRVYHCRCLDHWVTRYHSEVPTHPDRPGPPSVWP